MIPYGLITISLVSLSIVMTQQRTLDLVRCQNSGLVADLQ